MHNDNTGELNMSYTIEENKELLAQFMAAHKDTPVDNEGDVLRVYNMLREGQERIESAEADFAPTIKLAKAKIMDAENAIDALCEPLRTIEKSGALLLLDYEERKKKWTLPDKPEPKRLSDVLDPNPKARGKTKPKGGK